MATHSEPSIARSLLIDILRFLSASCIFIFHVGLFTHSPATSWGEYGVGSFIFLTGYCAVRYSRKLSMQGPLWVESAQYAWNRLKAIYPAYAAVTLLIFAGSYLYPSCEQSRAYSLFDLGLNLTMITQYVGGDYFSATMWFIPFVLQIYLLIPLLSRIACHMIWIPLSFVFSFILCLLVFHFFPEQAAPICRNWSPLFRAPEVVIGILVGRVASRNQVLSAGFLYLFCAIAARVLISHPPADAYIAALPLHDALICMLLLAAAYLFRPLFRFSGRFLQLLGKATLPFFLAHGVMIAFLFKWKGNNVVIWMVYFVLCWTSALLYIQMEQWVKNLLFSQKGKA